jgi:hypothetical protein
VASFSWSCAGECRGPVKWASGHALYMHGFARPLTCPPQRHTPLPMTLKSQARSPKSPAPPTAESTTCTPAHPPCHPRPKARTHSPLTHACTHPRTHARAKRAICRSYRERAGRHACACRAIDKQAGAFSGLVAGVVAVDHAQPVAFYDEAAAPKVRRAVGCVGWVIDTRLQ